MGENNKIRIGIDLDDVVFDFVPIFLEFYNEKYGKKILFEEVYTFNLPTMLGISLEETLNLIRSMILNKEIPLIFKSDESIIQLSQNYKIFFITSRILRETTLNDLNKLFSDIPFELIFSTNTYVNSTEKTKGEICKENKINFMIEDNKDYAFDCANNGAKVFLLDKPWNQNCDKHENILRVKNWNEILEKLTKKEENIVEKIRIFVENECRKPTSQYGYEPYEFHFIPTVKYAKILAEKLNADMEIVEIAAWLHDIGSIICGRKEHHIAGAEIAEGKLRELNYPEEKIELVKKCILNHRGSLKHNRESVEEQIVAEADAMSNFDNLSGIFKAAFIFENHNQSSAKKAVIEKLQNKWEQLSPASKEIIKPKYDAIILLFS